MSGEGGRAEVVGAGIVGLAAGALLARRGWAVRVHEQAPEIREVGAAIGIKPGAARVLRELDLLEQLTGENVLVEEERRDRDGRVLQSRRLQGGGRFYNPLRQSLVDGLREVATAHGAAVVTNSQVTDCDPDGTITMADGEVQRADLIVAADGFNSILRSRLGLAKKTVLLGAGTTRVLIPRHGEQAMRLEYWSGAMRIGIAPASDDVLYVYLSAPDSDPNAIRVPIDADYWASRFPGLPHAFFQRIHDGGGVRHRYPLVFCRRYCEGRVAVIGDAAHALPATLGIGASMGLVNANALVNGLNGDVPRSVQRWATARQHPSVRVQRCALAYHAMTIHCPPRLEGVRNRAMLVLNSPAVNARVLGLRALEQV